MSLRLDLSNPSNIELIDEKYSNKIKDARMDAIQDSERLYNTIYRYKNLSFEQIYKDITSKADRKYLNMNEDEALRRAVEESLSKRINGRVPKNAVNEIIGKLSLERRNKIIKQYKEDKYNSMVEKEVKKVKKDLYIFGLMSEEQATNYVYYFREVCYARNLYKLREEAIIETAEELGVMPPLCVENNNIIRNNHKILKTEEQNEKDISKKEKIKDSLKKLDKSVYENFSLIMKSVGTSTLAGVIAGILSINNGADTSKAIATSLITSSIVLAGIFTTYQALFNSEDIKNFFADKKTVKEAKAVGLVDLFSDWDIASRRLADYEKKINEENKTIEYDGGINGLHK